MVIEDHAYIKICAELASCLNISIASAIRRVEIGANKSGNRDISSKKKVAQELLDTVKLDSQLGKEISSNYFDKLLEALATDDNFMVED